MRVSNLVKKLFEVMSKHGDIPVVGDVSVQGGQVFLSGGDDTQILSPDDSEILLSLLRDDSTNSTTP